MTEAKKLLEMMAKYHCWAYEQLFLSLQDLPDFYYFDPSMKLFFGSIHGTLNHLCLIDRLWYGRFADQMFPVKSLDQELYSDRQALQGAVLEGANQWIHYVEKTSAADLNIAKSYKNTKGVENTFLPATTLLHVFNHGTHHRGQVTPALTGFGLQFEPLDIFYSPMYKDLEVL